MRLLPGAPLLACLPAYLLAACASSGPTPPPTNPASRGMRADAHLQAAKDHEARAAELARWPEMQRDPAGFEDPASGLWYRSFDTKKNEQRIATLHRTEAARLHAEYDEACRDVPLDDVKLSPLQRYGLGGIPSEAGVIVLLSRDAGPPSRLLAAMRCHRAWMMLGEAGMEECPLDVKGITFTAYGDETGISVEIAVPDRQLVPELQRRAAKDLEKAAELRSSTSGAR